MVEYKIFVDHQFKEIYNGEFKRCIFKNIIEPLSKLDYEIIVSKNEKDTIDILEKNKFDLVICTGYSLTTYANTFVNSGLKKTTKFVQVIYDMNAEKLIEEIDSAGISKIISQKSKLILLADNIIVFSNTVKEEIVDLYKEYNSIFSVSSKLVLLDYVVDFPSFEKIDNNFLLKHKRYIVIDSSINGAIFLMPEFKRFIDNLKAEKPKFKIVLTIENNIPKSVYSTLISPDIKDYFILLKSICDEDLANLYKYSIATIFLSSIDTNLEKVYLAINQKAVVIRNKDNVVYKEFFNNCSTYDDKENIIKILNDSLKIIKKTKHHFIDDQDKDLENVKVNSAYRIENLVNKIRTIENNKKI